MHVHLWHIRSDGVMFYADGEAPWKWCFRMPFACQQVFDAARNVQPHVEIPPGNMLEFMSVKKADGSTFETCAEMAQFIDGIYPSHGSSWRVFMGSIDEAHKEIQGTAGPLLQRIERLEAQVLHLTALAEKNSGLIGQLTDILRAMNAVQAVQAAKR